MIDIPNEELFQELDNEVAATCDGGYAILYENADFRGLSLTLKYSAPNLGSFNDKTSAIGIRGGETWAFYRDINYQNLLFIGRDGNYPLTSKNGNDQISSAKRIA